MKKLILQFALLAIVLAANRARGNNYAPTIFTDPPVSGGVNSTTGVISGGAGAGQVSLRSAVIAANAHAGADTITLGTGTYTLSISSGGLAENAAMSGDLDINDSVAITGNGPASTVITTAYDSTCGDGKVFGVNQTGTHNGLTVSFTGVTIQKGFNNGAGFIGSFFETGGGVDFFLTGTGNNYSMTNCVIANNTALGSSLSHGGGVNVDSANAGTPAGASAGTVTFNGCVFSNNTVLHEGAGLALAADKHDVTLINCTVIGNTSTTPGPGGGIWTRHSFGGTLTINGGLISGNTGSSGGGMAIDGNQITIISGVIITNNTASMSGGLGGGITIANLGATGVTGGTTITNCTIVNNRAVNGATAAGGGIYFSPKYPATVINSTISGNMSVNGAGIFNSGSGSTPPDALTLTSDTITGNTASGSGGGLNNFSIASISIISNSVITGNSAATSGGGIFVGGGTNTVSFSRIASNVAPAGKAIAQTAGLVTAPNNWWGTNAPAALMSGTVNFTPWLQLLHAANPTTIFVPNTTVLTATLLTNSAGTAIPVANLSRLIGLPITFNNAVRGTLSAAQATIQPSGTATATFTANAAGAGSADAVLDNQATTASLTIPTGVSAIDRAQTSPTNLSSVQWTVTFTNAVSGVAAGNFSLVNGGLGGSPAIGPVTPVGSAPATSWTVTASTGSGTGTLGLNIVNGAGVSANILNLPFPGQVYTIDLVPPDTTITAHPPVLTNSSSASFSFTGSDTGAGVAGFQYQLDGAAYAAGVSPVNFTGLPDGSHTFNVRAVDDVGNVDPSPATFTWTSDTTPPLVICSSNLTVTANGNCPPAVDFTVFVSDNIALASATTNPASGSVFPLGTNTVAVTAADTAGNTSFCSFTVVVQAGGAPELVILRSATNAVVSWPDSFPCYTLQFTPALSNNSWSSYPGPFTTNGGSIFVTNNLGVTNRFFRLSF